MKADVLWERSASIACSTLSAPQTTIRVPAASAKPAAITIDRVTHDFSQRDTWDVTVYLDLSDSRHELQICRNSNGVTLLHSSLVARWRRRRWSPIFQLELCPVKCGLSRRAKSTPCPMQRTDRAPVEACRKRGFC